MFYELTFKLYLRKKWYIFDTVCTVHRNQLHEQTNMFGKYNVHEYIYKRLHFLNQILIIILISVLLCYIYFNNTLYFIHFNLSLINTY